MSTPRPEQSRKPNFLHDYVTVVQRLSDFYADYPEGRIVTALLEHDREHRYALFKAEIFRTRDDAGPSATGHNYYEKDDDYLQKAETSSVGRALMLMGYKTKRSGSNGAPQQTAKSEPATATGEWNEATWRAGESVRGEIVDLENETAARLRSGVGDLRQFVRDRFKVAGPYECKATDLNLYKSYLRGLK